MSNAVFNAAGQVVVLGKELGCGGEGSVYEIIGIDHLVAKLYHEAPEGQKQAKLHFMACSGDEEIRKYTAWPQDTLHSSRGGPIIGFVMAKVTGMTPLQTLYSPAHRKQEFPERAWDFLLFAARNTAAAFKTLHDRGHVLGDVNHGNAYVSNKATIVLIDTDSYQINEDGHLHLCEVGVSHFTPPELQGMSFKGITRTANHDNFGLALLIFHLLFGGRHPYAGVPQRDGVGESLEDNIKNLRFAYSRTASQRLLTSPPNSLPLSLVPDRVTKMFEAAFTEEGRSGCRPTASHWLDALDDVRKGFKTCSQTKIHVFSNHLRDCPWCEFEGRGIIYFVSATIYAAGPTNIPINIGQVWMAISNLKEPPEIIIPTVGNLNATPTPLPAGYVSQAARLVMTVVLVVGLFIAANFIPNKPLGLYIIAGFGALVGIWKWRADISNQTRSTRRSVRQAAKEAYDCAVEALRREAGPRGFTSKREALRKLKEEFDQLPAREQREISTLQSTAEKRQKQKYLESFYIDKANLYGIGPAKRAALQSFGIETAADVEWNKIRNINGFGDVLTHTLVDWRKGLERNFRFNPSQAVTKTDVDAIKQAVQARRQQIERQLRTGLQELQQFASRQEQTVRRHQPILQAAAQQLAQAEADCSVI